MSQGLFVLACLTWVGLGLAFVRWPQTMFRVRHFPFTPEGDGLTESGESSYRLTGWFIAGVGFVLLLVGLTW